MGKEDDILWENEERVMSDYWMDQKNVIRYDQSPDLWNAIRCEQIDIMASIIEKRHKPGGRILDIGIGTGQIEEQLLMRIPDAVVVGVDSSPVMLDQARTRFKDFPDRFDLIEHDYRELSTLKLKAGGFESVISYDILHHETDTQKTEMLQFFFNHLIEGGILFFGDKVNIDFKDLGVIYEIMWERIESKANMKTGLTGEDYVSHIRDSSHHPTTLSAHLEMLKSAGFACACLHQYLDRVLLAGLKTK
ncbi:MAG: class I SAM-dependent methyltransferase [Planctomycetes bacterium]|nr:class I SAM-dependent methyltransferase [Planctomycetota bacterium]